MDSSGSGAIIAQERWRLASWIGVAALAMAFAHYAILPLAARLTEARAELSALRVNTYEKSWLDSTQSALTTEVDLLKEFHAARKGALSADSSVQAAVDRIRALAQKAGIEVIKTTPVLAKSDSLHLLKVKLEGYARFPGLMDFFTTLRGGHPDLFLEEMLIRQGGERSAGRLEATLVLHTYSEKREVMR